MIKILLQQLDKKLYKQLMYAFEQEFTQIVELDDLTILGVNVRDLTNIIVLEQEGCWVHGKRKSP